MSFLPQARTGRQLMVLDDAETIARQARRRAVMHRRRQDAFRVAVGVIAVASFIALVLGVSVQTVALADVVLAVAAAAGYHRLTEMLEERRRHQGWIRPGDGIGTPRPKGAFSITRHRSGSPVWIDKRAA